MSWKPAKAIGAYGGDNLSVAASGGVAASNGAEKRHTPITFDSPGGKAQKGERQTQKGERQIYVPPRNKFSSVSGLFSESWIIIDSINSEVQFNF